MFRIGEFSRIAHVSGRLLRYYDEIGLLSPNFTDPQTGYRYYNAGQLTLLNRILVLKELGLSLEQVAQLLEEDTSTDEIRGMLTLRKAQIVQTVQEELFRLRMIESRLEQIESYGQIQEPDVILKAIPARWFLALRAVLPGIDALRHRVQKIYTIVPALLGPGKLEYIALVMYSPVYDPDAFDVEIGWLLTSKTDFTIQLGEDSVLTLRELPAVETMATIIHAGRLDERHRQYSALATWLERNQWQITGPGREILMQLPLKGSDAEAVMEIQLPVQQRNKLGA